MRDICHIKKLSHNFNSFWFSSLLTMIFYSSYSRKLLYHKKLFNNDIDIKDDPLYIYLKEIYNKNNDYIEIFDSKIFNEIINLNFYDLKDEVIDHINNYGYLKSFFMHNFFNHLNINHLIIDFNKKDFYIGYSENIDLIVKSNNNIYNYNLPSKLNDYVNNMRKKLNNNIPEYIIVNIYNDTIISNGIDKFDDEYKTKLKLDYYNIDINGLDTFEKYIYLNDNKYILDSVSFDYNYDESIIGIHCNNKKFIYDEKSKLFNREWTFYNLNKKPKITMLTYVLYETKKINNIVCYSSVNTNLFINHWFNCFLTMFFQSSYSKKLLFSLKLFNNNDELSSFFNNVLRNNKIIKNYKISNIINLFNYIKDKPKLFKYINNYGYPINNFLPFFFDKFDIDFLMLDYYKKNFYLGFNENFFYFLDANNVSHTKFKFPNNANIDDYSTYLNQQINENDDFIPKYIIVNILNENYSYIDDFNDDYKEKLNFTYYNTNINGLNSFKDIIIFKGHKYKLDSISLNNSNTDKINKINNSIVGINCNDNKYLYNGIISSNKDPKRKLPCKLINYNWNIKNKSYFHIDYDKCSINRTTKNNKNTNNFSFNSGFRILVYVLLIDDYKYESDKFDYKSSSNLSLSYKKSKSSSSSSSSSSKPSSFKSLKSKSSIINKKQDIGVSPIIFSDKNHKTDIIKKSSKKVICPDDKIYNPKTNRCVSKNGKIGKELLKLN